MRRSASKQDGWCKLAKVQSRVIVGLDGVLVEIEQGSKKLVQQGNGVRQRDSSRE
jgi:hypothetical protein